MFSLNDLEKTVTKAIKDEIKKKDLIDTGRMLRSIDTVASKTSDGIEIDILAVDYFKYVNGNYDVIEDALNTKAFNDALDDTMTDYILNIIDIE